MAEAHNAELACTVTSESGGAGTVVEAWPNTSLYDPNTVIPAVRYAIPRGTVRLETLVTSTAK